MNEKEYIKMIRADLKKAKVFLKRSPNEIQSMHIIQNNVNAHIANLDGHSVILDPYACLKYCVEYINKSENGKSKLLQKH